MTREIALTMALDRDSELTFTEDLIASSVYLGCETGDDRPFAIIMEGRGA